MKGGGLDPPAGEAVHLWFVPVRLPEGAIARLSRRLTAEEARRAAACRGRSAARRRIVGRGALRELLGAYLGVDPACVALETSPSGKPFVASQVQWRSEAPLQFNLTHSGDWTLIAFAAGRPVGVDLERIRPLRRLDRLMQRCCTPAEQQALNALPPRARLVEFFRLWTRKEALVKAWGGHLMPWLARVEALDDKPRPADGELGALAGWRLYSLQAPESYVGALAVRGLVRLEYRRWPDDEQGVEAKEGPAGADRFGGANVHHS